MRLYEVRDVGALEATERPAASPGAGQAVVRVEAVSLNYRDLVLLRGGYGRSVRFPVVPCSDGAGTVVAVGNGVTRVSVGDRVAACFMQTWHAGGLTDEAARSVLGGPLDGMLREQAVLDERGLVRVPSHLSSVEAATLPCAAVTAWHALLEGPAPLRPGDTVLVLGTGGVSIFALQFAALAGAQVIVTSKSDAKLERARALGAWQTVNYATTPEWEDRVRALTGGRGVDHVIEVGGPGTLPRSIRAVRSGGTISFIGIVAGQGEVDLRPLFLRNIRLQGVFVGSRAMFEAMNRAIAAHGLRPAIDRTFAFGDAPAAFDYLAGAGHVGKVVITLD